MTNASISALVLIAVAGFVAPAPAENDSFGPELFEIPELLSNKDDPPKKVMCSWLSYGRQRFICGEGAIAPVKKRCDEEATKERGEKTECTCTNDQQYIQQTCD